LSPPQDQEINNMHSQELLPITLQREVSRLNLINEELALTIITRENTILAREVTIAARDARIAQLTSIANLFSGLSSCCL